MIDLIKELELDLIELKKQPMSNNEAIERIEKKISSLKSQL
jgi:hypothetical protein